MSGCDRDDYFALLGKAERIKYKDKETGEEKEAPDIRGIKPFLISRLIVDEQHQAMFTQEEIKEFKPEIIDKIFDEVVEINGIGDAQIEELEKN